MITVMLVAATSSFLTAPASAQSPTWATTFRQLQKSLSGPAAVSITGYGRADKTVTVGYTSQIDAWSTIKVPLAMAALQRSTSATTRSRVERALRYSDNGAAAELWREIGSNATAAARVNKVLAQKGDTVTKVRYSTSGGRSSYGRTPWRTSSMGVFMSNMACGSGAIVRQHLATTAGPKWGLKTMPRPLVKNGYGPVAGGYLVRQAGIIIGADGRRWGVSVTVRATSLARGQQDLTRVAGWLKPRIGWIPAKTC